MEKGKLHSFCLTLPGTTYDYQVDWQADRYHVGGKIFAMMNRDSEKKPILNSKMRS